MAKTKKKVKKVATSIANKVCCNPFNEHAPKFSGLQNITTKFVTKARTVKIHLPVNRKICNKCYCRIKHLLSNGPTKSPLSVWEESEQSDESEKKGRKRKIRAKRIQMIGTPELNELIGTQTPSLSGKSSQSGVSMSDVIDLPLVKKNLDELLESMGLEKLEAKKMNNRKYKEKVLMKTHNALAKHVFGGIELEKDEIIPQFRAKFQQVTDRREKIAILSCLPNSWSANRASKEFNVPYFMAKNTKDLVKSKGILFNVSKKPGSRTLPERTVEIVKEFYRSDEISRACPGMREYIMHSENGEKTAIQRRMILVNLREAYEIFKTKHVDEKVGFSKFSYIRPPECVLAMEKYGTHTTCVCCYHQNVKLTIDSMKRNGLCTRFNHYREFLELMICNETERTSNCHLNLCDKCPGKKDMEAMLLVELEEFMMEEITCKQWLNMNGKVIHIQYLFGVLYSTNLLFHRTL